MKHARAYTVGVSALLALFALSFAIPAFADDWLPVPPEDLAMKDNPKQPGADAMILYRNVIVNAKQANYDGDSDREYIRIKIFTQAGAKYGDVEIPFLKGGMDVHDVRGRTIKPDGSVVDFQGQVFEKTIVKASGVKVLAKTFTLPDVQPGCIIEYQYRTQGIPQYVHDEAWNVSGDIFTREAHFTMIPYTGYGGMNLIFRTYLIPGNVSPTRKIDGSYTMAVENVPGLVDEALMPPESMLRSRVEFFYRSESEPDSESTKAYWARIDKAWSAEAGRFVDKKSAMAQEVSRIVAAADSPEVKLQKIYARTLLIRNLQMEPSKSGKEQKEEALRPNSNVEDVLNHGYGNSRDINYLFVGLARAAGFDADSMFVAPRNRNLFVPDMQDSRQLAADIVWIHAGDKEYYLDPGAKFFPFGILPWYESDTMGIRLDKQAGDGFAVPVPVSTDAEIIRHADLEMADDGSAAGKLTIDFTGQEGALRREDYRNEDETGRKKALEDEIRSWLPSGSTFSITNVADWDNIQKPMHIEGTAKVSVFSTVMNRRILAPSEIFFARQVRSFDGQTRVNNIFFSFPYEEDDDVTLHSPAGYTVQALPKTQKIDQGAAKYHISATQQGDAVEVNRQLVVNGVMFSKEAYPIFRSFFNLVKSDDNSQIILQNSDSAKN